MLDRNHGEPWIILAGDHHHRRARMCRANVREQVHNRLAWHVHIEQGKRVIATLQTLPRGRCVAHMLSQE